MALIGSQWFHDLVCLNNRDTLSVATMSLSHVWFFASPRTIAHQAPLSMQFSRPEYWSGLSFPSPGSFLTQGANPGLPRRRRILYHLSWEGIINVSWSYRLHLIWMCVCVCVCVSCSVMSDSLQPHALQPVKAPLSMESSRQKYWSGWPFPSPGHLPTQGLNPGLLHCRQIFFYHLSHQGSPCFNLFHS